MQQSHPFEPLIFKNSHTLILGSFPSLKSFENSFYYANEKNQFWRILSQISGYSAKSKEQKIWLAKKLRVALWDIVQSCTRKNSADSNLEDIVVNDIEALLSEYPNIQRVAFTSRLSQKLYKQHFGYLEPKTLYLPSPSPAFAAKSFEQKAKEYKELLGDLL